MPRLLLDALIYAAEKDIEERGGEVGQEVEEEAWQNNDDWHKAEEWEKLLALYAEEDAECAKDAECDSEEEGAKQTERKENRIQWRRRYIGEGI